MAKAKLTLAATPTFKRKVAIPIPGGASADVEFRFKHKTRDQFREFLDNLKDKEDAEIILEVAEGWDLDDEFNRENIEKLVQNYMGSSKAVFDTYIGELTSARLGN